MAFSNYKNVAQVQKKFNIKYIEKEFVQLIHCPISPEFLADFEFVYEHIDTFTSEASRCETIIFPILKEVYKQYHTRLSLWIQKYISFDDDLHGAPDYLLASRSELGKKVLEDPLLAVVEAKKNDFEQGWGQCLAELVAIQKLNARTDHPYYGIVSDGNVWQFGKLVDSTFIKEPTNYTLDQLDEIFAALTFVFDQMQRSLS